MTLLELRGVTRLFGGVAAVRHLDLAVEHGTIHGLIGPNGSGKSTVFNLVAGTIRPTAGRVFFKAADITGLDPAIIVRKGIARTFQATQVFGEFTVEDNVMVASQPEVTAGFLGTFLGSVGYRRSARTLRGRATEILAAVGLDRVAGQVAHGLPHRDQKMLALANALATGAELIMLDEPMAGLTVQETAEAMAVLRSMRARGQTLLLIEHDMRSVMELCDRVMVLNYGEKVAEGTPFEVRRNRRVIETYLGAD